MARTFQNIRLFENMTAPENVMSAATPGMRQGLVGAVLRPPGSAREEQVVAGAGLRAAPLRRSADRVFERAGHNLSYGDQRRLEIARALATDPTCCCSTSRRRG